VITTGIKILLGFIGLLTLGIGGVGLMNIMLVSVTQRTREIGVEKALGARGWHILVQFLAEALAITLLGGLPAFFSPTWFPGRSDRSPCGAPSRKMAPRRYPSHHRLHHADCLHLILGFVGVISGMLPAIKASRWILSKPCATSRRLRSQVQVCRKKSPASKSP
jgi:putative ABC transport system permease protein